MDVLHTTGVALIQSLQNVFKVTHNLYDTIYCDFYSYELVKNGNFHSKNWDTCLYFGSNVVVLLKVKLHYVLEQIKKNYVYPCKNLVLLCELSKEDLPFAYEKQRRKSASR